VRHEWKSPHPLRDEVVGEIALDLDGEVIAAQIYHYEYEYGYETPQGTLEPVTLTMDPNESMVRPMRFKVVARGRRIR
jgi:hypothetical protein